MSHALSACTCVFRRFPRNLHRPMAGARGRAGAGELPALPDRTVPRPRPAGTEPRRRHARTQRLRLRARGDPPLQGRRRRDGADRSLPPRRFRPRSQAEPDAGPGEFSAGTKTQGRRAPPPCQRPPEGSDAVGQGAGGGIRPLAPGGSQATALHPRLRRRARHRRLRRFLRHGRKLRPLSRPPQLPHPSLRPAATRDPGAAAPDLVRAASARP